MGNSRSLLQKIVKIKENSEPVVLLKYTKKPEYDQSVDSTQSHSEAQHNGFSTTINNQENISTLTSTLPEHSNEFLCGILKTQNFNSSDGPKLEERLTNFQDSPKFGKIQKTLACFMGYGRNETLTIPEIVDRLLPRNYPELEEFNGTRKLVIFVPEWYLTKAVKYVDPSRSAPLQQYSEDAANACPE